MVQLPSFTGSKVFAIFFALRDHIAKNWVGVVGKERIWIVPTTHVGTQDVALRRKNCVTSEVVGKEAAAAAPTQKKGKRDRISAWGFRSDAQGHKKEDFDNFIFKV